MRTRLRTYIILCVTAILLASCAPAELRRIRSVDPTPLLNILKDRSRMAGAFATTMQMNFTENGRHFQGKAYLLVSQPQSFRLEVPGILGSTLLLMVGDGENVWAYYPRAGAAYHTSAHGMDLSPYLPFPFPLDPAWIPFLVTGSLPPGSDYSEATAYELKSGKTVLYLDVPDWGSLRYIFGHGAVPYPMELSAQVKGGTIRVVNSKDAPHLPVRFQFRSDTATLKAELEDSRVLKTIPPGAFLRPIPQNIPVRDLEIEQ
ncbi:MAG: hypothetical protein GXP52_00360 [Deltaproteobacteria bacterium]|nr:hypothetical protein [Deltaproteobacteria bacterium]